MVNEQLASCKPLPALLNIGRGRTIQPTSAILCVPRRPPRLVPNADAEKTAEDAEARRGLLGSPLVDNQNPVSLLSQRFAWLVVGHDEVDEPVWVSLRGRPSMPIEAGPPKRGAHGGTPIQVAPTTVKDATDQIDHRFE